MRKIILSGFLLCIFMYGSAQQNMSICPPADTIKKIPIKVLDWKHLSLVIGENSFDESREQVLKQIGEEEYNKAKAKWNASAWPGQEKFYDPRSPDFPAKLNRLKLYKIATYIHSYNGKQFGNYIIIKVPCSENQQWDETIQWDGDVYMVMPEKYTEEIK